MILVLFGGYKLPVDDALIRETHQNRSAPPVCPIIYRLTDQAGLRCVRNSIHLHVMHACQGNESLVESFSALHRSSHQGCVTNSVVGPYYLLLQVDQEMSSVCLAVRYCHHTFDGRQLSGLDWDRLGHAKGNGNNEASAPCQRSYPEFAVD